MLSTPCTYEQSPSSTRARFSLTRFAHAHPGRIETKHNHSYPNRYHLAAFHQTEYSYISATRYTCTTVPRITSLVVTHLLSYYYTDISYPRTTWYSCTTVSSITSSFCAHYPLYYHTDNSEVSISCNPCIPVTAITPPVCFHRLSYYHTDFSD